MYEEVLGLTGSQKVARVLLAINGGSISIAVGIWAFSSSSRHSDQIPAGVQQGVTEHMREKNDQLLSALYGAERRDRYTKLQYAHWKGPPGSMPAEPGMMRGPATPGMGGF